MFCLNAPATFIFLCAFICLEMADFRIYSRHIGQYMIVQNGLKGSYTCRLVHGLNGHMVNTQLNLGMFNANQKWKKKKKKRKERKWEDLLCTFILEILGSFETLFSLRCCLTESFDLDLDVDLHIQKCQQKWTKMTLFFTVFLSELAPFGVRVNSVK